MTETKKIKINVMVGRQNVYINLEWAAVLLTLRTTVLEDQNLLPQYSLLRINKLKVT